MKKTIAAVFWALIALHGAAALDFVLVDGSLIAGKLQGTVSFHAAFGTVYLDGKLIKSIALGSPTRIELTDGSVIFGAIVNRSFAVEWEYGLTTLELANIVSISGAVTAGQAVSTFAVAAAISVATPVGVIGGIEFVFIPGGEFSMGDSAGGGGTDERPVHKVAVDGFNLSKYEITLKQFKAFILDTDYKTQGQWKGSGDDYPVTNVSWEDADAFCVWFGWKYGVIARLPTEAEWEYAARGGLVGKAYSSGDSLSRLDANYEGDGTQKVGSFPPNGYGLNDMAGNVWEWCNDWYDAHYYASSPTTNPRGPLTGGSRVIRGGGWGFDAAFLRVARRLDSGRPSDAYGHLGFRLALPQSP